MIHINIRDELIILKKFKYAKLNFSYYVKIN